ncbi:MAG: riboflavin biosynthesis protein RibF [Elusimicrobia bacterium RIFOXYB2_FULL_50_12]|nr:MAG: riboflavin biosynthesis protein RibF [Elusimicrobia bacterium RIFOXYB2_FULL_50_12]
MKPSAVALGTFDGIHRGHRHIFSRLFREGKTNGLSTIIVAFESPVRPVTGVLSTPEEKLTLLSELPADEIILLPNSSSIISQPADVFFHTFIRRRLNTRSFIVGEDFALGHGRKGTVGWLTEMGRKNGIAIHVVNPLHAGHGVISSSRIRELLRKGKIDDANALLGGFYYIEGMPERGRGIATRMGFPTINIGVRPEKLLPLGVYCTWISSGHTMLPAVVNIGERPTFFPEGSLAIEAHIPGFNGQWPSRKTTLRLCHKLRNEKRFDSMKKLQDQIKKDVQKAVKFFNL